MVSITNADLELYITENSVTTVVWKDNCRIIAFGDVVRITDRDGIRYEYVYTDVIDPVEASAEDLADTLNTYLITIPGGGGGGGSVNSVNSGINIDVDNTDPANPIINSLSDRYKTTSSSSNSIGNGTKTFTVDANLSYIPLQEVLIVYDASNHMHGEVTSYSGTTLIVDVKHHTGSGTYTSWLINLDGTPVDALTGSGTSNEIAYFTAAQVLASLPVSTYPSLTELSYVKGVTSGIQSQLDSLKSAQITTILDGLGGVIQKGRGNNFLSIPFSGTITGWIILSSVTGSIEVSFWKDTYANYPPTVGDNVFSPNPTLSSATKNEATGLSIAVTAGDIIIPNVVSVATCTNVVIAIQITRT